MKLLDTDVFIDLLRGVPDAESYILLHSEAVAFCAVTEAELLAGKACDNWQEREKILHLLAQFEKVPVDNPMVQIAGDLRRANGLGIPDALIAAAALTMGAELVTRNIKDYQGIEGLTVRKPY